MKSPLLLVLLTAVSMWAQQAPSSGQPISITISGPTEVKTGTGVEIKIRLTNTLDHDIELMTFDCGVNVSYKYDVRDDKGNLVEKKNRGRCVGSLWGGGVRSHASVEDETLVTKLFNMSQPGQYVIQVSRAISDGQKDRIVKSNSIVVKVVP